MATTRGLGALLCLAGPVAGLWLRGVAERVPHQPMLLSLPRLGSVPG